MRVKHEISCTTYLLTQGHQGVSQLSKLAAIYDSCKPVR